MKFELTLQVQEWTEKESESFEPQLAAARKKSLRKLPMYMGISIVGLCALGFAVGAGVQGVLRLHLPIRRGYCVIYRALYSLAEKFYYQQKNGNKSIYKGRN